MNGHFEQDLYSKSFCITNDEFPKLDNLETRTNIWIPIVRVGDLIPENVNVKF